MGLVSENGKSFEMWCLDNNREDLVDRWDYELNDKSPSEISYGTKTKYYFKCPRGLHKSEIKKINDITNNKSGMAKCKKCNSFAMHLIDTYGENALYLFWNYELNNDLDINPWETSKGNNVLKVWMKCQEKDYHSYKMIPNAFLSGQKCPYCNNKNGKVHPFDSLGTLFPISKEIWSDKNKKRPLDYASMSNEKVWWKCTDNKHEDYKREVSSATRQNFRCPECVRERDESFLQEKVRLYLESFNYEILHENKCTIIPKNPKSKTNNTLPFDNEVVELKLIIETHGIQHYEICGLHYMQSKKHNRKTPEQELYYQKLKDRYKRIYAKSQGYTYLEIPYWTDNEQEDWKKLIDIKIAKLEGVFYLC